MPVEPRGLALGMWSQKGGVPLGRTSRYGATEAVGLYRGGGLGKRRHQEDRTAGETLFPETEALPEGESLIDPKDDPTYLPLNQLPTNFDLLGPYEGIRSFFRNMYSGQDFFVVNQMELVKIDQNTWSGQISLAKYQFTPNAKFDPNKAYFTISEDAPLNQEMLDFLQKKFLDNAFEKQNF